MRAKSQKGGGENKASGKAKAGAEAKKAGGNGGLARHLAAELERLREVKSGEMESSETTALGREFTAEANMEHADPHVRLLVAACVTELLRITAPRTPFGSGSDNEMFEVFSLLIRVLGEPTKNGDVVWYGLLETLATTHIFNLAPKLVVEDANGRDLVVDLFKCLFGRIREDDAAKVESNMISIMYGCLEEYDMVGLPLLETLLEPLLHQDEHPRAYRMAQQVISKAADLIQTPLSAFFNSALVEATNQHNDSELKEHTHTLIYETHKIQPSLLLYVLPNVCLQLQVDDVETRSNAIALMGRLFASSRADYGAQYMKNFREFLGRFRDVKKEIRLQMVQVCSIIAQRKPDLAVHIDGELKLRLQDPEWEVRRTVVNEVCDIAAQSLSSVSPECLREVGERMKDKRVIIRKEAMTGLAQIYGAHVSKSWVNGTSEPSATAKSLAWIPDYVLKCFAYPQQELRLRAVQLLDDILLPKQSTEVFRMKGLLYIWSSLDNNSREALRRISIERNQCRQIISTFIGMKQDMRGKTVNHSLVNAAKTCLKELEVLLPETEGFSGHIEKLVSWKDMKIIKHFNILCDRDSDSSAIRQAREDLVKMVGSKTPLGEFIKNVCRKLAMTTINGSSVGCLLSILEEKGSNSCIDVLRFVGELFPHLLYPHLETLQRLIASSTQLPVALEMLVAFAKKISDGDDVPGSLSKTLLSHCSSDSLSIVKLSARALVKIFPDEAPTQAKKIISNGSFSDKHLQCLAVYLKAAPKCLPSANASWKAIFEEYQETKQRTTKALGLTVLVNLVLFQNCRDHIRQTIEVAFELLKASTTVSAGILRSAAACNLLRIVRDPQLDVEVSVEEWHTLGYVFMDHDDAVRRSFLKKLKANLLHHPIAHRFVCYVALAATETEPDIKRDARVVLQTAVQRMRTLYENRSEHDAASSVLVPEYVLPYMVHLVVHAPWEREVNDNHVTGPLFLLMECLVSHVTLEADNISFLLQMIHKISLCHDALAPTDTYMYDVLDNCTNWLKRRIKSQVNLKAYPGQIFLPKSLFQPGQATRDEVPTSPVAKEKKRPAPVKVAGEKPPKKQKVPVSPSKPSSPIRRMPSRQAKNDLHFVGQDYSSGSESDEHDVPAKQQPAKETSNTQIVLTEDEDEEETKDDPGVPSDDESAHENVSHNVQSHSKKSKATKDTSSVKSPTKRQSSSRGQSKRVSKG